MKPFKVSENEIGERLDIFLQKKISDFSRNQIQEGIKKRAILVNGSSSKPAHRLNKGDVVTTNFNYFQDLAKPIELIGEKIPLKVLFEDENILVVDKPAGMVVHPAHGNLTGTLVNALLDYAPEISAARKHDSRNSLDRPGIVHRLDKDTSGVIVVAKNPKSLSSLSKQLANKQIKKNYVALVYGDTPESGEIESYLGRDNNDRKKIAVLDESSGKLAQTYYKKIDEFIIYKNTVSLISITIPTGRTHQIRVQMKSINYPIIGDQIYFTKPSYDLSKKIGAKRQLLHASKIEFHHPITNEIMKIESELPNDFELIIKGLS